MARWVIAIAMLMLMTADVRTQDTPNSTPSNDPQLLNYARNNPNCIGFTDLCAGPALGSLTIASTAPCPASLVSDSLGRAHRNDPRSSRRLPPPAQTLLPRLNKAAHQARCFQNS
jgi:hypothetical protein